MVSNFKPSKVDNMIKQQTPLTTPIADTKEKRKIYKLLDNLPSCSGSLRPAFFCVNTKLIDSITTYYIPATKCGGYLSCVASEIIEKMAHDYGYFDSIKRGGKNDFTA